jgi:hypothetical protein
VTNDVDSIIGDPSTDLLHLLVEALLPELELEKCRMGKIFEEVSERENISIIGPGDYSTARSDEITDDLSEKKN